MSNKLNIGIKIRSILLADDVVKELATGGIVPVWANVSSKSDFVLYTRGSYKRSYNNMGHVDECELILICASKDYDKSVNLLMAVDAAMERSKDEGQFQIMELLDSDEEIEHESGMYLQALKYRIY